MPDLEDTQPNKAEDGTNPLTELPAPTNEDTPASGVRAVNATGTPMAANTMPPPPPQLAYEYQQGYAPGSYVDYEEETGLQAPPKILFFGMIALFMLGIIGFLAGVVYFREGLTQGQQQRVVDMFPFMETFQEVRPTPEGGIIQRSEAADPQAADDLLNTFDIGGPPGGDTDAGALSLPVVETPAPVETTPEAEGPATTAEATAIPEAEAVVPATDEVTPEAEATAETTPDEVGASIAPDTSVADLPASAPDLGSKPSSGVNAAAPVVPTPTQHALAAATPDEVEANAVASPPAEDVLEIPQRTWATTALNTGFVDHRQTWNNCGPASISVALSYYGWTRDHQYAASYLKPNDDDKNVSPQEMVDFVNDQSDVEALWRMGGDMDLLRTLISNEFPVIIERGQRFEGTDWLGHYQTLVGYDDIQRVFYAFDTFLEHDGNSVAQTYSEVEMHWREFNYIFIVVYEPAREAQLMRLLGDWSNPATAAEIAFDAAQEQARANRQDAHAWFNMGTSLTQLGRFEEAAIAYDRALEIGIDAWRILWYQFGPLESYYEVGRHQDVIALADAQIFHSNGNVEELFYWRGRALAAQGRASEARTDFNRALSANRNFTPARNALESL